MTEKELQEQVIHSTEEPQEQQQKPKRRSFFQVSKGQMISTKDLWLQKFKSNSSNENRPEELEAPLSSPVELPHIEQLQPINTDISSEIQFHQHQMENNNGIEKSDDANAIEDINEDNTHNPNYESNNNDKKQQEEADKTQTESSDTPCDAAMVDPQHKKDQPIVKRSSILLKFLFPKKAPSSSTNDVIVTESAIVENHHQAELGVGNDVIDIPHGTTKEDSIEQTEEMDDNKRDTGKPSSDRPSSPLGRRINAFLSRIPTLKEKPSPGSDDNNKSLDTANAVDKKLKKEPTTADTPDANFENEKLASLTNTNTTAAGINANNSIVAV